MSTACDSRSDSLQRMVSRRSPALEQMLKAYRILWDASAESEDPYRRIALAGVRVLIEREYQRTNEPTARTQ